MTTGKLLWGMTWRGGAWGILTAIVGNAANVILGSILAIIWTNYGAQPSSPLPDSGIGFVIILLIVFSPIVGMGIFLSGISTGFLSGLVTIRFFYPLGNAQLYKKIMILTGIVFNLLIGLTISTMILGNLVADAMEILIFVIVPSCVNSISGFFITFRLRLWYERESAKGSAQNV